MNIKWLLKISFDFPNGIDIYVIVIFDKLQYSEHVTPDLHLKLDVEMELNFIYVDVHFVTVIIVLVMSRECT